MSNSNEPRKEQTKIVESLIESAKRAFDSSTDAATRENGLQQYNELVESTETWILLHALNALIKPNILPQWLREPLMQTLTLLPLRPDGVRGTMEFVFAVHPSNTGQPLDTDGQGKAGAAITHEAVAVATKLLSSVPRSMSAKYWFEGISGQLFDLFDGAAGPDIAKTSAQVVGFGILGKKQFGAPGAPGWNAFVQPLIEILNPSLKTSSHENLAVENLDDEAEIVELGKDQILVTAPELERSLRRLELLIMSNTSPGLCKRLLKPVILQLWSLSSWPNPPGETDKQVCKPARILVQTHMKLFGDVDSILPFIRNLLVKGSFNIETPWRYQLRPGGGMQIIKQQMPDRDQETDLDWNEIESRSTVLVALVTSMCTEEEISSVFLHLLRRWIVTSSKQGISTIKITAQDMEPESPLNDLVNLTILQRLMDKAPDKLVSHFDQLLELVCQVLQADSRSSLGDDLIGILLSLLNLVITAPTFKKADINASELEIVEESLERLSGENRGELSTTARNLAMLLRYRDEVEKSDDKTIAPTSRQIEDRKTYNLAMNYITGDGDNPPPVVSEGLNILSSLIVSESPILDINAITVLMSSLLKDSEDYINLRVIKIFTQLANKHPKSTLQELLYHYLDSQEKLTTDMRLRYGEAILQVIERLGETFAEDAAQDTCERLLSIASRRGHRPKTMAKQARDEKLNALKSAKADNNEQDNVDIDLADEEESMEEKEKGEILAQIVQGWESKRGSEDVRMRTSALSILGIAIETNIIGIGPDLVSAGVDLSINVLALEPELEKGILRRAAVLVILSFVKALDKARESGQRVGFGLMDESRHEIQRTLQYVAATDNDGLVQQHVRDVIESLENWDMTRLLHSSQAKESETPGLSRLAGLRVNPGGNIIDDSGRPRPRIEEVE